VLVGNGDAHGKNLSLLHGDEGAVRLAPAYDVFSTLVYPDASTTPGMFVNGVRDIAAIRRDDLIAEAGKWGVPADMAAARIEPILRGAEDAIARTAEEISCPEEFVDALIERARAFAA
jgi:serine/threonine-protein kinase HipA